ncbi:hypothetical protein TNCV_4164171 [Trichonephila clavipes]|nr:hypothetical protein TNCV_4164171 [Trichonephila clavipes]
MSFNRACRLLEQIRLLHKSVCHGYDEVTDQTLGNTLFHSSRSAISSLPDNSRRPWSQQCVVRACPKHARLGFRSESTLAIPCAVLFQLQACSPPDELYAVGHYLLGKQRNLQWLQRAGLTWSKKYLVGMPFGPSKCHSE